MNTAYFDVYHNEIFNFLRTVSIKFEPMKKVIEDGLLTSVNSTLLDFENNNYYYERLMGNYIPSDTPMYVTSIDTGEQILFSKENLEKHPQTKAIYRIPNTEYDLLCQKYPTQKDLIKSIVYPVVSISQLKNSDPICYLNGDTSLLQSNEILSIIEGINHFCNICYDRWWVKEYCFEEGYPIAFYALMWQLIPLICFTKRMTNIKTASAHNYHIWEYLCSKGLEDYRDILSIKQSLFLYRNMEYILANKGTMGNLFILADNILADFSIALVGKYIYQQQIDRANLCRRTPEIISKQIVSYNKSLSPDTSTFESVETINGRMYVKGIEVNNSSEYINNLEKRYGEVEEDRLPTKLLELRKEKVSTSYEALLIEFIFDTILYRYSQDKVEYYCDFVDPLTHYTLKFKIGELIALLYYFSERSLGSIPHRLENYFYIDEDGNYYLKDAKPRKYKKYEITSIRCPTNEDTVVPEFIPNRCMVRIPYILTKPDKDTLPKYIYVYHDNDDDNEHDLNKYKIDECKYRIDQFVDIDTLLNEIPFNNELIFNSSQMENLVLQQFKIMVKHIRDVRLSADLCYHRGMLATYHKLCACGNYSIKLTNYSTYAQFFGQSDTLLNMIDQYNEFDIKEYWDIACAAMFKALLPITNQEFKQFIGVMDSMSSLFEKLTSLCIQLFSFRVTLLGTDRDKDDYCYLNPLVIHHLDATGTSSTTLSDHYFISYEPNDATTVYDDGYADLSYFNQKDLTTSYNEVKASSMDMHMLEYGESVDNTRIRTLVKYTFDFTEADFEGVLTDGYDE